MLSDGDGNPRGIFDGSGNFLVGNTSYGGISSTGGGAIWCGAGGTGSSNTGFLGLNGSSASNYGAIVAGYSNGTKAWFAGSYSTIIGGTNTYFVVQNISGGVYLNGASATSWTAVSDETRKIIIEPITDAANKVSTLRAVIGRLKTDEESVRRPYLIAQDVKAVLPEAVSAAEDKEGPVLGLSYTEVIPLLVAAIKELKAEVDSLKSQLNGASA